MEAEQKNFDFAFLFDLKSSEHLYYRCVYVDARMCLCFCAPPTHAPDCGTAVRYPPSRASPT